MTETVARAADIYATGVKGQGPVGFWGISDQLPAYRVIAKSQHGMTGVPLATPEEFRVMVDAGWILGGVGPEMIGTLEVEGDIVAGGVVHTNINDVSFKFNRAGIAFKWYVDDAEAGTTESITLSGSSVGKEVFYDVTVTSIDGITINFRSTTSIIGE